MTDQLGWRGIYGILAPSTNTTVEADYNAMRVPGVTCALGRIHIRDQNIGDDAGFEHLLEEVRAEIDSSLERLLTCKPDHLVMGMSAETFWGGVEGSRQFQQRMEDRVGKPVYTGARACREALEVLGCERIAVLSPYQAVGDENVRTFFGESGFDVVRLTGLRCPTAVDIARVGTARLISTLRDLDGDDVDAIVQVGTNLSMVSIADEAERWLGKPVIAINAATWWSALRGTGITDQFPGAGSLLREH